MILKDVLDVRGNRRRVQTTENNKKGQKRKQERLGGVGGGQRPSGVCSECNVQCVIVASSI